MGVQRQVVCPKIDVVLQQQSEALLHPAGDPAILSAPEKAVVHEDRIGPVIQCGLDQRPAGGHARHDPANLGPTFDLQSVGSVILEATRLEQPVKSLGELFARNGWGHVGSGCSRTPVRYRRIRENTGMKRLWLLFAQTVTVLVGILFVVATLQPQWLGRSSQRGLSVIPVFEAPAGASTGGGTGSFREAAKLAAEITGAPRKELYGAR